MVFLAMTRQGFDSYCRVSSGTRAALWVAGGVVAPEELRELRARGLDATDFSRQINPSDADAVAEAVSTIREHCPNDLLWVEA